jgi:integrase
MRLLYEEWQVIEGVARVEHHLPKHYRSSRACELIDIGEPTLVVRDWMGHSTVTTTERFYASPRKRMRAAAVNLGRAAGTTRGTTEPSSDAEST